MACTKARAGLDFFFPRGNGKGLSASRYMPADRIGEWFSLPSEMIHAMNHQFIYAVAFLYTHILGSHMPWIIFPLTTLLLWGL